MRTLALCLCMSLLAAPAFAQEQGSDASAAALGASKSSEQKGWGVSFGFLDQLKVNRSSERPVGLVAPYEKEELGLSWRPGSKWGITLDLTSRSENEILPREELTAGAYYQITPRFRFGGGVTLNGDSISSAAEGWRDEQGEAGVRIESAFAF